MRVYVASSWRNDAQQGVVARLRAEGHIVYDFKNPPNGAGFAWRTIAQDWESWTPAEFREALAHPDAVAGYQADTAGMDAAEVCVMVQPCGRSAALEAGWCRGAGKRLIVLLAAGAEPELMVKMAHRLCLTLDEVVAALREPVCLHRHVAVGHEGAACVDCHTPLVIDRASGTYVEP